MRSMRVRFSGETNIGLKRSHNEDNFFMPDDEQLAIVADGMGGHASGEVASKMAVDTLAEHFRNTAEDAEYLALQDRPARTLRGEPPRHRHQAGQPAHLRDGAARRELPRHGHDHRRALFLDDKVLIGHVGD